MTGYYERAIYDELGIDIANELKKNHHQFVVNYDNATYTFLRCPKLLMTKILQIKKDKGARSILNEFVPNN